MGKTDEDGELRGYPQPVRRKHHVRRSERNHLTRSDAKVRAKAEWEGRTPHPESETTAV
jgi:hypothetical protein